MKRIFPFTLIATRGDGCAITRTSRASRFDETSLAVFIIAGDLKILCIREPSIIDWG
jgi:hypothetical protein